MKIIIYVCITVFGLIGSYIPVILFHADAFSAASIITGAIGSLLGVWAGYKLYQYFE